MTEDVPFIDFIACRDIADESQKLGKVHGHCIAIYYNMDTAAIRYLDCIGAVPAPAAGEVLVVIEHPMCPDDVACAIADAVDGTVPDVPDYDEEDHGWAAIDYDYRDGSWADLDDIEDPVDDVSDDISEYFESPMAGDFDHLPDPFEPIPQTHKDDNGHGRLS